MSYNIKTIPKFDKSIKKLAQKYPSIKAEFIQLVENLKQDPFQGIALGKNCFKIRMAIASKGVGKSGGAIVITHIVVADVLYTFSLFMTNLTRIP